MLQSYMSKIKSGASQVNYEINSWRDLEKWFSGACELDSTKEKLQPMIVAEF